jgi:hypothetical protein
MNHRSLSSLLLLQAAAPETCSRGSLENENLHGKGNNKAHKCRVKYQGYDWRVVPVDLVLGVVSSGRGQSTTAPGEKQGALTQRYLHVG